MGSGRPLTDGGAARRGAIAIVDVVQPTTCREGHMCSDNVLVDLGIVLVGVVAAVLVLTVAAPADHGTSQPKRETGDGEDT